MTQPPGNTLQLVRPQPQTSAPHLDGEGRPRKPGLEMEAEDVGGSQTDPTPLSVPGLPGPGDFRRLWPQTVPVSAEQGPVKVKAMRV